MPHCILEHSANVPDRPDAQALLKELHALLVATGEFAEKDLKSRVVAHEQFRVAEGGADRAFVALTIRILEGRPDALKERVAGESLSLLRRAYPRAAAERRCSFSVEIVDMHRASYRRFTSAPG